MPFPWCCKKEDNVVLPTVVKRAGSYQEISIKTEEVKQEEETPEPVEVVAVEENTVENVDETTGAVETVTTTTTVTTVVTEVVTSDGEVVEEVGEPETVTVVEEVETVEADDS